MSKNAVTIEQLNLACRHFVELRAADMTENMAIRQLELFANVYAKCRVMGNANPDYADQYDLWSKNARKAKNAHPNAPYGSYLRIEHGTPRRHFARLVLKLFESGKLTQNRMNALCARRWKIAVITIDEDRRLSRSELFATPEKRWAAANIRF